MSKSILITGGCGFVGSNLAILLKKKYPAYKVICLDNLKRRGSELNISRFINYGISFLHGDIRNKEDLHTINGIDFLIECSADPSVLAGMDGNTDFVINTNLLGTVNCLNLAVKNKAGFIFLSTNRVYSIKYIDQINYIETENRFKLSPKQDIIGISKKGINEDFPLKGSRSLYGTSKLASELIIEEFSEIYNLKTVINRCGTIAGPYQMGKVEQGLAALWVASHYWKKELAYIGYGGKGKQVRDILNINDLFILIDFQINNLDKVNRNIYNVGGAQFNVSLKELTYICEEITGNKIKIHSKPENRKADIRLYITDNTKVTHDTCWIPTINVNDTVYEIYKWICKNEKQLKYIFN